MPWGHRNSNRVAVVGASSLRGKELKLVLEDRNFPASDIILLDESVAAGTLTEAGGEPTFIRALDPESFDGVQFAFFAGTAFDAERNWLAAQQAGATVIDLTGAVTASGRAAVRISSLDSVFPARPSVATNGSALPAPYYSPPTPVILACTLAAALSKFSLLRVAMLLFPPVSERDQAGIEELESQTTNLLSFRPIERTIFDAQVAFNLLSQYGPESKPALAGVRTGIAADVARYLAGRASVPAIQLVQAPIFYGYAFSANVELASSTSREDLEAAFAPLAVKIEGAIDSPSNIRIAGESDIHMAPFDPDPNVPNTFWIWGVADNLRVAATNAVQVAENLIEELSN